MDFSTLHFAVDGDSITAGDQWSGVVARSLGFASHYNVAVGSAVWYKRTLPTPAGEVTTQNWSDPDFAGISDGWLPTEDPLELQRRANNCAVVHVQRYLQAVAEGQTPVPDVFAFAMGTNDLPEHLGRTREALMGKTLTENPHLDLFTEAGAVRWCLQTISEHFPDCRLFVLTPIPSARPEFCDKLEETAKVLRTVAGALSAQVIDCLHNCGISEKFEVPDAPGRYLRDGLHPDRPGQELMGRYIAKEIRNNLF